MLIEINFWSEEEAEAVFDALIINLKINQQTNLTHTSLNFFASAIRPRPFSPLYRGVARAPSSTILSLARTKRAQRNAESKIVSYACVWILNELKR